MAITSTKLGAVTLFVTDLDRSKSFYTSVFGWNSVFENHDSACFDAGVTLVNLLLESSATEQIAPAPVAASGSGNRVLLTIFVESADDAVESLRSHGVAPISGPTDHPWGQRTACFLDPDGYVWEFAQNFD